MSKPRVELTPELQEQIFQTFILRGNKRATAAECGVSPQTVAKVLREIPVEQVEHGRMEVMAALASRIHDKVAMAIETLQPVDFEGTPAKRVPVMQKTTAIAILTDKFVLLQKHILEYTQMLREAKASAAPVPQDLSQLAAALQNQLRILAPLMPQPQVPAPSPPPQPAPALEKRLVLRVEDFDNAGRAAG